MASEFSKQIIEALRKDGKSELADRIEAQLAIVEDHKYEEAPESAFIFPRSHEKVKDDNNHFPIDDEDRARNALAQAAKFDAAPEWWSGSVAELQGAVKRAVQTKYKDIEVSTMDMEKHEDEEHKEMAGVPPQFLKKDDAAEPEKMEEHAEDCTCEECKKMTDVVIRTSVKLGDVNASGHVTVPVLKLANYKNTRFANTSDGNFEITRKHFQDIVRNFKEDVLGRDVSVDIDHNHRRFGAVRNLFENGDHLYADVELTPIGKREIAQFAYSSPEFVEHYTDKLTGKDVGTVLKFVSLTNDPFQVGIEQIQMTTKDKTVTIVIPLQPREVNMDTPTENKPQDAVQLTELQAQNKQLQDRLRTLEDQNLAMRQERATDAVQAQVNQWIDEGRPRQQAMLAGNILLSLFENTQTVRLNDQEVRFADAIKQLVEAGETVTRSATITQHTSEARVRLVDPLRQNAGITEDDVFAETKARGLSDTPDPSLAYTQSLVALERKRARAN